MVFAHILLVAGLAYMLLLGYALSRPRNAATLYFMAILVISVVWDITYYLELMTPGLEGKVTARLIRMPFLIWLATAWLLMTCHLFDLGKWLPRPFWWINGLLNVTSMGLAVTSPCHQFFMSNFHIHPFGYMGILTYLDGPWYRLYIQQQNALALFSLGLMITAWWRSRGLRRRNLALLIVAFVAPLALNMAFTSGRSPVPDLNLAPFTTMISVSAFAWVVLRYRAFDLIPLARTMLLDHLPDPVLVTDRWGRVVDMNAPCAQSFGRPLSACAGQPADHLPEPWRSGLAKDTDLLQVGTGAEAKWYDMTRLSVQDDGGYPAGQVYVWRNVSIRHRVQLALRESEDQLRMILDSMSEAVFIHDASGRVQFVNKPMLAMYGIATVEQALQLNIFVDYSAAANDIAAGRAAVDRALAGERATLPRWLAQKPTLGQTLDVRVIIQRIYWKAEPLLLATVFDLREELQHQRQELAYQKLLEEKKYLRQIELLVRDLHDGVGGILAGISLVGATGLRDADPARREEALRKIADLASEGNVEVRSLMNTLETRDFFWPDLITEFRRHGALMQENHDIIFTLRVEGEGDAGGPGLFAGMSLFRIFKEALNNVIKHARATEVSVGLAFAADRMRLTIADNGQGLRTEAGAGRGLRNMRQRIGELGGTLVVYSAAGLTLELEAPLPLKSPQQGMAG